ncbi:MAG: ribosome-associated translation inhibitor RaiA [Deltaproteobacteria bacterium]|nr:MAG: ribosome-associated translation inhibitor RaiA [Deltaproteobacteria bacterium]
MNVVFRHMDQSDAVKDYAIEKLSKIKKYLDGPIDVNVVLSVEKIRQIAEVKFTISGFVVKGKEEAGDMYAAIDMVASKISRQVQRYKGRLRQKKGLPGIDESLSNVPVEVLSVDHDVDESIPKLIKKSNLLVKPMSPDEAIMQLNLMGNNFHVFRDESSDRINVVYRRDDGHYGLIEPQ